jgi:hypothetical protein
MANQWTASKIATFLFNLQALLADLDRIKHPDSGLPLPQHYADREILQAPQTGLEGK